MGTRKPTDTHYSERLSARIMKPIYQAHVTSSGGRDGYVKSSDGLLDFPVSLPKEMGGKGSATNPEQLFAAGYAACFENAVIHIARQQKIVMGASSIEATVGIGPMEGGTFGLSVILSASLPELDQKTGLELLEAAHKICPYSNAVRGNISVELRLARHK